MIQGGDPTYHAEPGESLEDAAVNAVEKYRMLNLRYAGKKLTIKPGETAAALAARFQADAK